MRHLINTIVTGNNDSDVIAAEDREDLAAFNERADEPVISYEELLREISAA
jgi:hypothetical protein